MADSQSLAERMFAVRPAAKIKFVVDVWRWSFQELQKCEWYLGENADDFESLTAAYEEQRPTWKSDLEEFLAHRVKRHILSDRLFVDLLDLPESISIHEWAVDFRYLVRTMEEISKIHHAEIFHIFSCFLERYEVAH